METVNLFGAQRGRAAQAAAWAMEKERFSTQEMANALAVSTPTAITLLRRLEGHGLVQPCGEFSSTGGRKPRAWSACPGARYVVGADITLRHVSLVAVDLSGQVTRTQTRTLAFTRTPAYFRALAAFISELCAELPRQSVLGVGLSIPGIIGIFLNDYVEKYMKNAIVVAIALIVFGIGFIVLESTKHHPKYRRVGEITYQTAFLIGLFLSLIHI